MPLKYKRIVALVLFVGLGVLAYWPVRYEIAKQLKLEWLIHPPMPSSPPRVGYTGPGTQHMLRDGITYTIGDFQKKDEKVYAVIKTHEPHVEIWLDQNLFRRLTMKTKFCFQKGKATSIQELEKLMQIGSPPCPVPY